MLASLLVKYNCVNMEPFPTVVLIVIINLLKVLSMLHLGWFLTYLCLVSLFLGRWENFPKCCQKFDDALIWHLVITKRLNVCKGESILSKEGRIAPTFG